MTPAELQRWAERETQALIAAGISPQDAERSVKWVLAHLPPGADPETWIPSPGQLETPVDTKDAIADARVAWYASATIPATYKRLLDATEVQP